MMGLVKNVYDALRGRPEPQVDDIQGMYNRAVRDTAARNVAFVTGELASGKTPDMERLPVLDGEVIGTSSIETPAPNCIPSAVALRKVFYSGDKRIRAGRIINDAKFNSFTRT